MTCGDERFRHAAGPYLLGALDAGEQASFVEHLDRCPGCRDEVARLRPVVGALGAVTADEVAGLDDTSPVPDTLLPGLLARAARTRRRRRTLLGVIGSAAAAAIIALTVVLVTGLSGRNPSPEVAGQVVTMRSVDGGTLAATATVTGMPWGTEITLHCHYQGSGSGGSGHAPPPRYGKPVYILKVTDTDGSVHNVGSWTAAEDRDTVFTGGTAVPPGEIGRIEVVDSDGTPLLSAAG